MNTDIGEVYGNSGKGRTFRPNHMEWVAYEWLRDVKNLDIIELCRGEEAGEPDFIYLSTTGYEVKILYGKGITFERKQYEALRCWRGDVLVFKRNEREPHIVIPFSKLPANGGVYKDIVIWLRDSGPYRSMISCNKKEKDELESLRTEIELNTFQQDDWADLLLQSIYCVMADLKLMRFVCANRIGTKHFTMNCPYCNTINAVEGQNKLYWLVECEYCHRRFVTKRDVVKK